MKGKSKVLGFEIEGEYLGQLNLPKGSEQGHGRADDFPMKIGFVLPGVQKLSGIKKWMAPKWIKKVYSLAPRGIGLDYLELFVGVSDPRLLGKKRKHPKSDFFHENFVFDMKNSGGFKLTHKLENSLLPLAVWLSADGDGSKSQFQLKVKKIKLITR